MKRLGITLVLLPPVTLVVWGFYMLVKSDPSLWYVPFIAAGALGCIGLGSWIMVKAENIK